jgi:transcriptional regulator with XRE-family HTH domain
MPSRNAARRERAVQTGFVMRAYRESFVREDGRRGLTQEELLRRMGEVDVEYSERFSHATVSRWESGGTRPAVARLQTFGKGLNLSPSDVVGLMLMAGVAPDYQAALEAFYGEAPPEEHEPDDDELEAVYSVDDPVVTEIAPAQEFVDGGHVVRELLRFGLYRCLLPGVCVVALGYALSALGWNDGWMPMVYIAVVSGLVLAQGFFLSDQGADLREFFRISVFFLLTTPLLQFHPLGLDHYNFYAIGGLSGTQMPYLLSLLLNLGLASVAGLMFHVQWRLRYSVRRTVTNPFRRAAWVACPPVVLVYGVVVVITNISVSIQLAVLLPILALAFTIILALRDPSFLIEAGDRRFLLYSISGIGIVSAALGVVVIIGVYVSPELPMVLPDHNLFSSWELDFEGLGYSREEALDRVNLGYVWHAMGVFVYMAFIVGGNLFTAIYRTGGGSSHSPASSAPSPSVAPAGAPVPADRRVPGNFPLEGV